MGSLTLMSLIFLVLLPLLDHGCDRVIHCGTVSRVGICLHELAVEVCNLAVLG